jgi:1,4-dihydroxy-2-naphthoate octaprenyltransferase
MAYLQGRFDTWIFVAATVGIVMAHSAADFIDDYFDFKKGNLGNKVQQFHDSPLIDGKVTPNQVLAATAICLTVAFVAGLYIFIQVGTPALALVAIGAFIVFFYTSPPVKLNYRGLGETALFMAFGPMIVVGVYIVLTGEYSLGALLVSLMPGVFTMNVGVVSNTYDYLDDIKSGKRTMSVRFGQANTVRVMAVASALAYVAILIGVFTGLVPAWALLSLLTVPLSVDAIRHASHYNDESHYTPAMTRAIALSSVATLLLTAGHLITIFTA